MGYRSFHTGNAIPGASGQRAPTESQELLRAQVRLRTELVPERRAPEVQRHALNNRDNQAAVQRYASLIKEKGVLEDVRGTPTVVPLNDEDAGPDQ
eukprot:8576811-Lingulodinium_polyedra.AAC.1